MMKKSENKKEKVSKNDKIGFLETNEDFISKENKADELELQGKKEGAYLYNLANSEIKKDIKENLDIIKKLTHKNLSGDIMVREFFVKIRGDERRAFAFFIDGLVDRANISHFVLNPLMHESETINSDLTELDYVSNKLIAQNTLSFAKKYGEAIDRVCFGECGIFVDGLSSCILADVKSWEKRGVSKPATEGTVLGPQEAFTELIRANTAMLRKTIKDPNLIIENVTLGEKSKTPCALCYIKTLANEKIVNEVRKKLSAIKADYLFTSDELIKFLEEKNLALMPQILRTERPDRTATELVDGNICVLVNGSPFALIMPVTFFSFMKTTDNNYMRMPYANLLALVRYTAMVISVLLPALFVVITNFHHEMIPTDLLYALEASFEKTPFPAVFELIILEIAFELIREAVIKFPSIGGPSIGIVGALVLGQAAVTASIVSPIIIIIVAATAVGSLSTPNYSFGLALRIMKFVYIIFSALAGFIGFSVCLFVHMAVLVSMKSYGVRYFSPVAPRTKEGFLNAVFVNRNSKKTSKPDYVNTKGDRDE